jgi:uncharacterized membrane protein
MLNGKRMAARPAVFLLLLLAVIGSALRICYFKSDLARTPDERTYTRQANIVLLDGADGFRFLGRELERDPVAVSRYPSPARVGYIALLAAFMRGSGDNSLLAGAHISLILSILSLALAAFVAYRFLSPTVAVAATLLLAVFPFDLTIFRRTWQESFIAFLTAAFLTAACFAARSDSRTRLWSLAAFSVLGFLALTTKENSGIAFMLCAAGLTTHFILGRNRRAAILTACCAALALVGYVAVLAWLFGGVFKAFELVREHAHYSGINPYNVQYDSGPIWMFPAGFIRTSPLLFFGALAGFAVAVLRTVRSRRLSEAGLPLGLSLLAASIVLVQLATQRYCYRYTAPVYVPICLLAGIGIEAALKPLHKLLDPLGQRAAWTILGVALSVAALRDLNFARETFILPQIPDLTLRPVLGVPPAPLPPDYPR